ncbi:MAG: YggS family pyridoxal phosphate-dependent enzyme [Gammaproteobacteria bacterium]|nr:YggS family pyridoxal phosphate-dependent enzyme [Gammaproteobacteria bacterium]MBU6509032.1 YggS family pyridoxal phosphate-dependent enzyme [Gammaproteobacteria bacterium]MDE1984607.1 YggS family pyridoxal phosphate-dependent enzyme [Gammaproteobacteria bacterium]MDE2108925.1 YggS family pyridoxal phosphate-dependent enzyme [Gammaproteobacteria bacterium]
MTPATPESIAQNLAKVRARIARAATTAGRDPGSIRLLAVSKAQPLAALAAALDAGQNEFGENYLQQALPKMQALAARREPVWHFIGAVQTNKTRLVAENFAWVHTVDRQKIAQRLNDQRPAQLPPLNVCIEVNVSGEHSKTGVTPQALAALAALVADLPRLKLRGLMAIPAVEADAEKQHPPFRRLRELLDGLNIQGYGMDTLSMGMSADFEVAIAEGATLVRLGTAIFGARAAKHS